MKTAFCDFCQQELSIDNFRLRKRWRKDAKHKCNTCRADYYVKYNKEHNKKSYEYKRIRKDEIKTWFLDLKTAPCTDCHNKFPPCCMDFDHIGVSEKKRNVAVLVGDGYSKEIILAEIAKCELVCANCHRIRTQGRGWNQWDKCKRGQR